MLSRHHFERIADIVSRIGDPYERKGTASEFARWLDNESGNELFDKERFLAACEQTRAPVDGGV